MEYVIAVSQKTNLEIDKEANFLLLDFSVMNSFIFLTYSEPELSQKYLGGLGLILD
jgi:hypothetical protein